jgi:hypothetical protein
VPFADSGALVICFKNLALLLLAIILRTVD